MTAPLARPRTIARTARHVALVALGALALAAGSLPAQAYGHDHDYHGGYHRGGYYRGGYHHGGYYRGTYYGGWGWGWPLVAGVGVGIGLASVFDDYPPGYVVVDPPPVYYAPPAPVVASPPPPVVAPAPVPPDPIFYPRNGQSAEQMEVDRRACNQWATTQPQAMADASVFQRATLACMDGRGYTAR